MYGTYSEYEYSNTGSGQTIHDLHGQTVLGGLSKSQEIVLWVG